MLIHVGYDITVEVAQQTPFVLMLDIHNSRRHDIRHEEGNVLPETPFERGFDHYGNRIQRLVAEQGQTTFSYRALVRDGGLHEAVPMDAAEIAIAELPDYALHYVAGSRYCETDQLGDVAWQLFGSIPPGAARVQAICDFVHSHLRFDYQQARATRTALEAYNERVGVCRDFAHLAIAFCRCLNIPARYVNGYLGDIGVPADPAPMDFSAWFEAYIGHQWVTFDARHNKPRIGRIVIARGRDATDVAMVTSFGQHKLVRFNVIAEEVAPDEAYRLAVAA